MVGRLAGSGGLLRVRLRLRISRPGPGAGGLIVPGTVPAGISGRFTSPAAAAASSQARPPPCSAGGTDGPNRRGTSNDRYSPVDRQYSHLARGWQPQLYRDLALQIAVLRS